MCVSQYDVRQWSCDRPSRAGVDCVMERTVDRFALSAARRVDFVARPLEPSTTNSSAARRSTPARLGGCRVGDYRYAVADKSRPAGDAGRSCVSPCACCVRMDTCYTWYRALHIRAAKDEAVVAGLTRTKAPPYTQNSAGQNPLHEIHSTVSVRI